MAPPRVVTVEDLLRLKVKIVFRPLGKQSVHGYISGDNTIEMDPRTHVSMAKLLLHELLHAMWPLMSEHAIEGQERLLWKGATWRQRAALYQRLGKARIWEGEDAVDDRDAVQDEAGPGLQQRVDRGPDRPGGDEGGA